MSERPVITFRAADQWYALQIDDVVEVAGMVELVHTANVASEVIGVADRHGTILPILDFRRVLGQAEVSIDINTLFIVVRHEDQLAGIIVDEVHQVEYLDFNLINRGTSTFGKYIRGIISHRERVVQIVALAPLFDAYLSNTVIESGK